MQTLYVLLKAVRTNAKRSIKIALKIFVCALLTPTLVFTLASCGTLQNIHVDHTVKSTSGENICAKAYRLAQKNQQFIENNVNNVSTSDLESYAKEWETVAQQCPGRLSESIVYSAKAKWEILSKESGNNKSKIAEEIAGTSDEENAYASTENQENPESSITHQLERNAYIQFTKTVKHYNNFQWTHHPLASAAAAEDQLAFILQTLAAKKVPGLPLEYSDMASTNAQTFMNASGKGDDLRKKIYEIPSDALESGKAQDKASGKDLPIAAIAYMDCARTELTAFNQIIVIEENKTKSASKNNRNETSYEYSAVQAHKDFKDAVIKLITSRLLRAYALGYPTDTNLVLK
ncbi:hypothetical protein ACLD6A_04440 [Gardnerella sp. Marseille-Q9691]|uniref:hypothetical protein n=1 Tax=Gardnerella sp. Marseille-Q9691 TaxID=3390096 RepID=UPI0039709910